MSLAARREPRILASVAHEDDVTGWRMQARALAAAGIPPERVEWRVADAAEADLFGAMESVPLPLASIGGTRLRSRVRGGQSRCTRSDGPSPVPSREREGGISIAAPLLALMQTALLHGDPARFALCYRLLWRSRSEPRLADNPADADMISLHRLAKAVRRDIHKMHAFVRFRLIGAANGRERFGAWFEPEHHIVAAVAPFFRNRFAGMDWLIVTPRASIAWDGTALRVGPGGTRADVPADDALEAEWRTYYASIFNPARVKVAAMKSEMPVKYWRNLPEAPLIGGLVAAAQARTQAMIDRRRDEVTGDLFAAPPADDRPLPASLDDLYRRLAAEDAPPGPDFSDRLVTGEGPAGASLMLVGEQPGDREDELGRVFVGPAGQRLDRALSEAGIDRGGAFLTNAVKRFKFVQRGRRRLHQSPTGGDIEHYRWWLEQEIRLVAPKLVVALGSTAATALTGRKLTISRVRGEPMAGPDGRALLVTVHPSFLLRLPDEQGRAIEQDRFVRDLARARRLAAAA
jgi:DNA polymerase